MTRTPPAIRLIRELPAAPEEVFDAWTEPAGIRAWMCPGPIQESIATLDVHVGGRFRIVMREAGTEHVHTGEYLEVDRPRRLAFTWVSSGTRGQVTRVTITLRRIAAGRTELALEHEALPDVEARARHEAGWGDILTKLAQFIDTHTE